MDIGTSLRVMFFLRPISSGKSRQYDGGVFHFAGCYDTVLGLNIRNALDMASIGKIPLATVGNIPCIFSGFSLFLMVRFCMV